MSFCTHCGAKLPDGAKFCTSCGNPVQPVVSARTSDDGRGIVIDAPEDATVTFSTPAEEESFAPEEEGEFVAASWSAPQKAEAHPAKPAVQPRPAVQERPVQPTGPAVATGPIEGGKERRGCNPSFILGLVITVAIIALLLYLNSLLN